MTLSNAFPKAPVREWAKSPALKRRLDPQADYKRQAWDGERTNAFASWHPVVLSPEEIAQLKQKPGNEPKDSPVSETPEAFQKTVQPKDENDSVEPHALDSTPVQAHAIDADSAAAEEELGDPPDYAPAHITDTAHNQDLADEQTRDPASEQRHADAVAQGYATGHAAGLTEGVQQGLAQAAAQQAAALDTAVAALTQAGAAIRTLNDKPSQHFEPLKRLALHLAEELVRGELLQDSAAIERLVQAALEQLDTPAKRVRVALHPDDLLALTQQGKQPGAGVVMVADKTLLRGGVRVTSNDAVVQDLIDNRLRHLADELLIDKARWLNASDALKQGVSWATPASVLDRMRATEDAAEVGVSHAPAQGDHNEPPASAATDGQQGMNGIDHMSDADVASDDPMQYRLTGADVLPLSETGDSTGSVGGVEPTDHADDDEHA